jgi:hypothetical protein
MQDSTLYPISSYLDLYISINLFDYTCHNIKYNFKSKTNNKNYKQLFFKRFIKFLNNDKINSDLISLKDQYNNKLLLDIKPNFNFRN